MSAAVEPTMKADLAPGPVGLPATALTPLPRFAVAGGRSARVANAIAFSVAAGATLLATAVVAVASGLSPMTSVAVVATWWALMFCARSATPPMSVRPGVARRLRPAAVLAVLCCLAALTAESAATPVELVLLGMTAVAVTGAVEIGTAVLRRHLVGGGASGRLVIVGATAHVTAVLAELARSPVPRWRAVAVCAPQEDLSTMLDLPLTVGVSGVVEAARTHEASGVLVLPSAGLDTWALRRLSWELERDGRQFLVETGLLDVAHRRTTVLQEGGLRVLHIQPAPRRGSSAAVKEVIDRLAATLLLLFLVPVLVAVAIAIRLDSRGPVIFRQSRVGRDGAPFTIYKFRTMTSGADAEQRELIVTNDVDGILFKMRADPRVTRTGRVLRTYSLDELPQLWNVVRGQMSLVGPRPALPDEVSRYSQDPQRRLVVKPGITGLWQVSGRSDLSWEDTVRLDVQYVDNWSLGLDLSILWRTVGAVLHHRGAY